MSPPPSRPDYLHRTPRQADTAALILASGISAAASLLHDVHRDSPPTDDDRRLQYMDNANTFYTTRVNATSLKAQAQE
ncbi:hypothetical protein BJ912DRAFT_1058856 [Pholiota molesta]|nr:hypothetical protein BJ912DRAFT_1058856 [Pholiota molesta]